MSWCKHEWKPDGGCNPGLVDYGGPVVYGTQFFSRCKLCGKFRSKVATWMPFKVYKRADVEAFRKSQGMVKPPRQLEFR